MSETKKFSDLYKTLNPAQKKAVDTVEGPVLVVAGPGTGKTHILTLRIANILKETQANPSNILALTFTDSAARTMRRRLAEIVGEQVARDVTISTFHGFAELILSRYPERFTDFRGKRLMGDVEQVLLYREAIENTHLTELRPPKAPYTYLSDLKALYDTLTREGVSLDSYKAWGDEERARIQNDPALQRKRGDNAGSLTQAGVEKLERVNKVDEAASVLQKYEELKEERGVYDFTDMLRIVIMRIEKDESLRADLQEQYQYVLADEHQDANALQHKLLELFAYDDFPNIFVVGDEKQAIYRFQGADLTQFRSFTDIFPRATVITLTSSFRSFQNVLDTAHQVIESTGNHERLTAERGEQGANVSLIVGSDPLDERAKISELISKLIREGTAPHEIAVISRKNETADLIANQLEARGVPVLRAGDVSLTSRPLVHALLALMQYVADPVRLDALRRALLAPWWGIPVADILKVLRTTRDADLLLHLTEQYPAVIETLTQSIEKSITGSPIECFSYLFSESGARGYLLSHADHIDDIALVRQLMMHLEEAALLKEGSTFKDAMETLARAGEHEMSPVKTSLTEREGFVTVITAHKAKGMEFKYVVIPDLTENGWEKGGKAALIPSPFTDKQPLDDAQRLFYVALTRAKDHAYLTYGQESKEGRERKLSVLLPSGIQLYEIESSPLPLLHQTEVAPDLLVRLTRQYLTEEGLAPTHVNEYLKSPPTFFARRVLRMKEPAEGPAVLGNSVHTAIAYYLNKKPVEIGHASIDKCFRESLLQRGTVFDDLVQEAHAIFTAYIADPKPVGTPTHVEKGFKTERKVNGETVLMQGKVDAVFEIQNGTCIIDFKTGSTVSAKNEEYVRQLMLYTYLLESHEEHISCVSLIALSKDGTKDIPVALSKEARDSALAEFDQVVTELLSGKWRKGEPSEYDDLLTLLTDQAP